MTEEKKFTEKEFHKKMAIDNFNGTWNLIDKGDKRTPEEDDLMVHRTHASRLHWGIVGNELNFQRGEWQIARVYTLLKRKEPALHFARVCLKRTEDNGFKGFDLPFAHEAMARACALNGDKDNYEKHYDLAKEAGEKIEKKEDRDYFFKDLDAGKWFGMK